MEKIKVCVVGYGNIGKYAVSAVKAAEDMELVGVVDVMAPPIELIAQNITFTNDVKNLGKVDVAIISVPSRKVEEIAKGYLELGISTVDSYDIHSTIYELRTNLGKVAKENNAVSIVSAGWDPGSDSILRSLFEAIAPKGITYTNFGPGMSMGHSVAARTIEGVKDALSITIPLGTGIHRRMVYVELENNAVFSDIESAIKNDSYFIHDETHVIQVDNVDNVKDVGHGVNMIRKGVSGDTHNQIFEFDMRINNPALTSQILVSCARAATRMSSGGYTMIEVPVAFMLAGSLEDNIRRLV